MNAKARRENIKAILMYTASALSLVSVASYENWLGLTTAGLCSLVGGLALRAAATAAASRS